MRLKAIPFWEQHIEKFVLGGALLVLIGVLVMQLLSAPRVGSDLAPNEINDQILAKAETVRERQRPDAQPMAVPPKAGEIDLAAAAIRDAIDGPVAPSSALPQLGPVVANSLVPRGVQAGQLFHEPALRGVAMLEAPRQFTDEFTDQVMLAGDDYPLLAELIADGDPSVTWTVPVAVIDLNRIRAEFERSSAEAAQVPSYWRNDTFHIVDVVFERRERNSDGSWSDPVVLEVPEAAGLSFRQEIADLGVEEPERRALRDRAFGILGQDEAQTELLQPSFYPTTFLASAAYLSDPRGGGQVDIDPELLNLMSTRTSLITRRSEVESRLAEAGGELYDERDTERDRGRDRGRGRGGRGGQDGGGGGTLGGGNEIGGGGGSDDGASGAGENRDERIRLTRQRDEISGRITRMEERLASRDPDWRDRLRSVGTIGSMRVVDVDVDPEVLAWTHDPSVESGATYQYRCRVSFYNPFFERAFQLEAEQDALAAEFTAVTEASEWSDPVAIQQGAVFFVSNASAEEGTKLGTARIEVFRQQDGRYWREEFTVRPGDSIGAEVSVEGADADVDFSSGWFVVDIVPDPAGDSALVIVAPSSSESRRAGAIEFRSAASDASATEREFLRRQVQIADLRALGG